MRRKVLLTGCLSLALAVTACQDQKNELTAPATPGTAELLQQSTLTRGDASIKTAPSVRVADIMDPLRVVTPTACDDNTPIVNYFLTRAFQIPLPTLFLLINNWADLVPTYESLLFQNRNSATFFGYNGEYNERMNQTERDVKLFWDIKSDDIQV